MFKIRSLEDSILAIMALVNFDEEAIGDIIITYQQETKFLDALANANIIKHEDKEEIASKMADAWGAGITEEFCEVMEISDDWDVQCYLLSVYVMADSEMKKEVEETVKNRQEYNAKRWKKVWDDCQANKDEIMSGVKEFISSLPILL